MKITIDDVAKAAGVSIATVSKVINNRPQISDATRERVINVMKQLDFHPNARASNFAKQRSNNIVYLAVTTTLSAFQNPHMFEILCGAQNTLQRKHYNVSFTGVSSIESAYQKAQEIIGQKTADGILVHGSATSKELVKLLVDSSYPHVIIGRPPFPTSACWIDINNRISGQIATRYLGSCGYRKIAFIGGPKTDEISRHRLEGFVSTMADNGLFVEERYLRYGEYTKESGYHMAKDLLSSPPLPDAIICENNLIAFGAVKAIEHAGKSVPADFGLITFDDYPLSQLIEPPITVVDIDVFDMGQKAAEILSQKIRNPGLHVQSFSTVPKLIVRSSTRILSPEEIL